MTPDEIAKLRERRERLRARGIETFSQPIAIAPVGKKFATRFGAVTLTARELAFCEAAGADPRNYAALKAGRAAAQRGEDVFLTRASATDDDGITFRRAT